MRKHHERSQDEMLGRQKDIQRWWKDEQKKKQEQGSGAGAGAGSKGAAGGGAEGAEQEAKKGTHGKKERKENKLSQEDANPALQVQLEINKNEGRRTGWRT